MVDADRTHDEQTRAELARRLFALLSDRQLSPRQLDLLEQVAGGSTHRRGHPSPFAKWASPEDCLDDLCQWAAGLPASDLPPLEADAARHFGVSRRTVSRWLSKSQSAHTWEDFCRYFWVAQRDIFGPNGQLHSDN